MAKKWPEIKQYRPINPEKYVGDVNDIKMRSSWEMKFSRYCDNNPSIVKWNSEGVKVPYWSSADEKERTYHVDFVITIRTATGSLETIMIEIKPYKQTIKPEKKSGKKMQSYLAECHTYQVNLDKWRHANEFAKSRGWRFLVMTEEQLYGENVKK